MYYLQFLLKKVIPFEIQVCGWNITIKVTSLALELCQPRPSIREVVTVHCTAHSDHRLEAQNLVEGELIYKWLFSYMYKYVYYICDFFKS